MSNEFTAENYRQIVEDRLLPVITEAELRVVASEFSPHHHGSFFIYFDGPFLRLKIIRDRLQFLLEVAPPSQPDEWIDDETILNLLGRRESSEALLAVNLRSLELLASTIHQELSAIINLFTQENVEKTMSRADEYRRERAQRLFGYVDTTQKPGS